jgi:hypothetical protein
LRLPSEQPIRKAAAVGFLARSVARRSAPVRPKAILLAIGGVVLALTVIGELMLVAGLTK